MRRCHHNVDQSTCGFCIDERNRRNGTGKRHGSRTGGHTPRPNDGARVFASRNHPSFDTLSAATTKVVVVGKPVGWVIDLVLARAPQVRTIRIEGRSTEAIATKQLQEALARGVRFIPTQTPPAQRKKNPS